MVQSSICLINHLKQTVRILLHISVVQFNHRSVFPIMFDGNAVDNWWKSALVFKVYARSAGQKVVCNKA